MGLREMKARRTREAIADTALSLFEHQGYEATTMEQIAEAAEVSPSTLYRYFPTKDSTLLDHPVMSAGSLADDLEQRPAGEPVDEALGQALDAYLAQADADAERLLRLRRQVDLVPTARARVWDLWYQERVLVQRAIAKRVGAAPDDLWVQLTAHTCLTVAQISLDQMRSTAGPGSAREYGAVVLEALHDPRVVSPRLPGD